MHPHMIKYNLSFGWDAVYFLRRAREISNCTFIGTAREVCLLSTRHANVFSAPSQYTESNTKIKDIFEKK